MRKAVLVRECCGCAAGTWVEVLGVRGWKAKVRTPNRDNWYVHVSELEGIPAEPRPGSLGGYARLSRWSRPSQELRAAGWEPGVFVRVLEVNEALFPVATISLFGANLPSIRVHVYDLEPCSPTLWDRLLEDFVV